MQTTSTVMEKEWRFSLLLIHLLLFSLIPSIHPASVVPVTESPELETETTDANITYSVISSSPESSPQTEHSVSSTTGLSTAAPALPSHNKKSDEEVFLTIEVDPVPEDKSDLRPYFVPQKLPRFMKIESHEPSLVIVSSEEVTTLESQSISSESTTAAIAQSSIASEALIFQPKDDPMSSEAKVETREDDSSASSSSAASESSTPTLNATVSTATTSDSEAAFQVEQKSAVTSDPPVDSKIPQLQEDVIESSSPLPASSSSGLPEGPEIVSSQSTSSKPSLLVNNTVPESHTDEPVPAPVDMTSESTQSVTTETLGAIISSTSASSASTTSEIVSSSEASNDDVISISGSTASLQHESDGTSSSPPAVSTQTSTATPPAVTQATVPEFQIEDCKLSADHGPCDLNDMKWWYDTRDGVCKVFYYGGCGGNNNRFSSRKDCEMKCWNSQDICKLKKVRGICSGNFVQWYYDHENDQCVSFNYSGCVGNANRFSQKESCEAQCMVKNDVNGKSEHHTNGLSNAGKEEASPSRRPRDPACLAPADPGTCTQYLERFFYDPNENTCRRFVYKGCKGNSNRFESREKCEERCVTGQIEEEPPLLQRVTNPAEREAICRQNVDQGTCEGTHARWFYDPGSFTCLPFIFSGCGGNRNRFKDFNVCIKFCNGVSNFNPSAAIDVYQPEDVEDGRRSDEPQAISPFPDNSVLITPSTTTTTIATTTQKDLCRYECADSPYFGDCGLVVEHKYCDNINYAKYCCKSCLLDHQLDIETAKHAVVGPLSGNYHAVNESNRLCFQENFI